MRWFTNDFEKPRLWRGFFLTLLRRERKAFVPEVCGYIDMEGQFATTPWQTPAFIGFDRLDQI